jgi:acyl carrier protein
MIDDSERESRERHETGSTATEPSQEAIEAIVDIWADLLELERSEIDPSQSDFFQLGGHSVLAMQVVSRTLERFKARLPEDTFDVETALLYNIFDVPTVASMAECLQKNALS